MSRGRGKQNRLAKLSISCMVCLLVILMSTQIVRLYQKNQELIENTFEQKKLEEEARSKELEALEKTINSREYIEQEAHRYGLFYDDEIIYREKK